jgi:hypothetical protein
MKMARRPRRGLTGELSSRHLRLLNRGTRKVQQHLKEMAGELDRVHAALDATLAKLGLEQQ